MAGSLAPLNPTQMLAQAQTAINTLLSQALNNPLAILAGPILVPVALAGQTGQRMQAGTIGPKTIAITVPMSGVVVQLQPSPTPIAQGQLYNAGPGVIGVGTGGPGTPQTPV